MEKTGKRRWGVYRWIVLGLIIFGVIAAILYPPIQPHVQLAPEKLSHDPLFTLPVIGAFYLTNTIVAIFIVDTLLIVMAFFVRQALSKGEMILKGIPGALEMLIEALFNMTENTAGKKWAKTIFPYFMTIVLVVLLANWMEMLPGVDSIGLLEPSEDGHAVQQLIPGVVSTLVQGEASHDGAILIPFVRVASTDLNFTAALALISVVMTQVIGLRAQGPRYLLKFFNVTNLFKKPFLGVMDWVVSLLELVSEFAKIVSFTFRLFGVMFSGMILIFLIGSMIPYFLPSFVYMFEFFMGLIQAMVFGLLTMVFMSMATQGHGEHEEAHE